MVVGETAAKNIVKPDDAGQQQVCGSNVTVIGCDHENSISKRVPKAQRPHSQSDCTTMSIVGSFMLSMPVRCQNCCSILNIDAIRGPECRDCNSGLGGQRGSEGALYRVAL